MMSIAAQMGVTPQEFWDLHPDEFYAVSKGLEDRTEFYKQLAACNAAWQMSMWSNRPIKPQKLLGNGGVDAMNMTTEQMDAAYERLKKGRG